MKPMKKEPEKALEKKQASNSIPKEKGLDLVNELQKKRQQKKIILISLVFVIGFF